MSEITFIHPESGGIKDISGDPIEEPEKIEEMKRKVLQGKAQIFDVREREEWERGHLEIAKWVPLSTLQKGEELDPSIDRSLLTYLHCESGRRVNLAAPLLETMNFEEVIPLKNGFEALVRAGMEKH